MFAIIGKRTIRICLIAVGLFLLISILLLMQNMVKSDSEMRTLHFLASSMLRASPLQLIPDPSSEAKVLHNSSGDSLGILSRLKSAFYVLLGMTGTTASHRRRGIIESRLVVDWTTIFGRNLSDFMMNTSSLCPVPCTYSNDRTLVDQADAVVFHIRDTNPESLPTVRHSFQRYIFFLMESPHYSGSAINRISKNFFNWTMTYRRDSDILADYDRLTPKSATDYPYEKSAYSWDHVLDVVMGKKKMVVQFVSNCHTASKRENYVYRLAKSISVDVFGSCSEKKCIRGNVECTNMLTNDYLFYLAFENSVCLDYVTEKFWQLKMLIVPIVLRASDYAEIAPSGSYIAADQFKSPKDLATYLNRLANNRTEYLTYFEWTKHFWILTGSLGSFCDLCVRLHNYTLPSKSYDNMEEWWTARGNCKSDFAQKLLNSSRS